MIRRLVLAKYQYRTGLSIMHEALPMSGGLALSLFHDAVETMAWTTVSAVEGPVKDQLPFTQLWEAVKAGKKNTDEKALPLQAVMLELNKVRVAFKHYGIVPDVKDVDRLSVHAEEFLRNTMHMFFGQEFDRITMADIIEAAKVRNQIKISEQHLAEGDFKEVAKACAIAEHYILAQFENIIPDFSLHRLEAGTDNEREIKRALSAFYNMRKSCLLMLSGGNIGPYLRFRHFAPRVQEALSGHILVSGAPPEMKKEDAEFCLKYATDYALKAQDHIRGADHQAGSYYASNVN